LLTLAATFSVSPGGYDDNNPSKEEPKVSGQGYMTIQPISQCLCHLADADDVSAWHEGAEPTTPVTM